MNDNIRKALKYGNSITDTDRDYLKSDYVINFWDNKETITWKDLCEFASTKQSKFKKPVKFSLGILVYALENDLYQDKFKDKLHHDLADLKKCISGPTKSYYTMIFNFEYDEIQFYHDQKLSRTPTVIRIAKGNLLLTNLYIKMLSSTRNRAFSKVSYSFIQSIGSIPLEEISQINSVMFWEQISFFKSKFKENAKMLDNSIEEVCRFYRWLVKEYSEYDFFKDSLTLSNELVFSTALIKGIKDNAHFTTYGIKEDLEDKPIIIFLLRNFHNYSTIANKNSWFRSDLRIIKDSFYRNIINKYMQNVSTVSFFTSTGQLCQLKEMMHFIEQIKEQKNYPNPSKEKFNSTEAVLIRKYIYRQHDKFYLSTLNNKIGVIRRFLIWAKECNYLLFDETFFDYFSQIEEPDALQGKAIPDEDLKKISDKFLELCIEDVAYESFYAIFLILLETEFRVSQVCSLTVNAVHPTLKNDQFVIYSNTKTTNGRKIEQPICLATKRILDHVIENTESLRNESVQSSYHDLIFLRKTKNRSVPSKIDSGIFYVAFKRVCELAGVKKYNSRNLRDTHMTKAFEFILKSGKSDLQLGILSRHSHIDTTKNHYIEMELTKMLESTYQVTLEDRDKTISSSILDDIPASINTREHIVENGCGRCKADKCTMLTELPCLKCKHFVTTIRHKQYFINAIKNCDRLLSSTTIRHEIEDITLIKTLYASWLRELCIKEEENRCLN